MRKEGRYVQYRHNFFPLKYFGSTAACIVYAVCGYSGATMLLLLPVFIVKAWPGVGS